MPALSKLTSVWTSLISPEGTPWSTERVSLGKGGPTVTASTEFSSVDRIDDSTDKTQPPSVRDSLPTKVTVTDVCPSRNNPIAVRG